jgi:hypothetical protein
MVLGRIAVAQVKSDMKSFKWKKLRPKRRDVYWHRRLGENGDWISDC